MGGFLGSWKADCALHLHGKEKSLTFVCLGSLSLLDAVVGPSFAFSNWGPLYTTIINL